MRRVFDRAAIALPWLLPLGAAVVAFLVAGDNLSGSPDTLYDESVYTLAAQSIAARGELTWGTTPVFVHPPLFFVLQSAWLMLRGQVDADLFSAVDSARLLTITFGAINVFLTLAIAGELLRGASRSHRLVLLGLIGLLAAFDPVLLRYSRIAMIESVALTAGLATIYVAWRYRESTRLLPLVLIGVLTGIALLTKEVSIFLVVTPLVFAIFRRSGRLLARALVSLAVGIVVWLAFPAWSLTLGLGERFVDLKLTTFERLIGVLQLTGWNRPNVSFLDALIVSAPQYAASYALLLIGAAAFVWLFLRRTDPPGMFLAAWLATSFGFGAFTTVRGQLNEQFFTYLMPGAIIAVVVAADAVVTQAASGVWRRPWPRRFRRLAIALPIAVVTWIVVLGTTSWYGTYHAATDDGIQRTSQFIVGELQPCDFVNGGGEVARYAYNLPSERTSDFSSGPRALSRGVHYFLLRPKDVWARYGNMTPDFAEWIQTNGVLVASFESDTYWGSQIWHVATGPYDPVADIQPIDDGFFVNTVGSACGGYEIRGTRIGDMVQAYRSYGGKRVVGRPRSTHWNVEDGRLQLFDAAVFKSVRDADGRLSTAPIDLITELMRRSPEIFAAHDLPEPNLDTPASWTAARVRLTDDGIARAYLGVPLSVATSEDWTRARERWGDPISLPVRLANGTVRQAFDRVVWERRREKVDLTVIADAVIDSGMVPVSARRISPVPRLETAREPTLRSDVSGLGVTLVGAVLASVAMAGCAEAIDRTRSRRDSSRAVVSEIAPRREPGTR